MYEVCPVSCGRRRAYVFHPTYRTCWRDKAKAGRYLFIRSVSDLALECKKLYVPAVTKSTLPLGADAVGRKCVQSLLALSAST